MVWIKICGITDMDDAKNIGKMGPDAMGFVFYKNSPRYISLDDASTISGALREKRKVSGEKHTGPSLSGIFVNENIDTVAAAAKKLDLDYIQLSGDEDNDYLYEIKKKVSEISKSRRRPDEPELKTIKSVRIGDPVKESDRKNLFKELDSLVRLVDFVLLDSYTEKTYGGTGIAFDRGIVRDIGRFFPVILSGGLDAANVIPAMDVVKPFGVDASSRLEVSPGKKDITRVGSFIETVRKWNRNEE